MPVDNYLVFYIPYPDTLNVKIIRVMYGGRDADTQLNKITKEYTNSFSWINFRGRCDPHEPRLPLCKAIFFPTAPYHPSLPRFLTETIQSYIP